MIWSWVSWWCPGVLPQSITSTSRERCSSTPRGASRSTTTTSANARSRRPRTVISPSSPGPPPTRCTVPGPSRRRVRVARTGSSPVSSAAATASRMARERPGSRPPDTATKMPSALRATAGVHAAEREALSARTHHMRRPSASAATASSVARSPVAVCTSQAPEMSPTAYSRACQVKVLSATIKASSSHTHGAITSTSAPAVMRDIARRAATGPPPTTTTRRPSRSSTSGYDGLLMSGPHSAREPGAFVARWARTPAARCRPPPRGSAGSPPSPGSCPRARVRSGGVAPGSSREQVRR